ncbi:adenosylcobinamide-phosphate synthase CbiB [Corynebacterium epidermidicanis]|uniref:Cobalamin biosynthesis protein CobD n=1 Tax=Corynebacterium epidermidicanis TaxID=1050174 RepID=A0A0G3GVT0_9CORY|nr:adenosylcobinamide-phosphate synthase CbiB [Corynebacterium epidermidicanis]AKK03608.1 cobalamin biosynthesis protein CobD [Corynebacterium epidermidicanis]
MRALAIGTGLVADRVFADPEQHHPVAYFGTWATVTERLLYRDSTAAGVTHLLVTVAPVALAAQWLHSKAPTLTTAATLWIALGGSSLTRVGEQVATELSAGHIERARTWVPWLCSRDPQQLDDAGIARAATESIAENTSDAAIAPLFWAAVGGAPTVVVHRCVNTLDAMVGYRNERYNNFGWAAANLDDLLAYVPARLTAGIHTLCAAISGRGSEAVRAWKEDASAHPSPNAGPVEATAAAALGVQLGGPTIYPHGTEQRPRLSRGPKPTADTVRAAVRLARRTQLIAGVLAVLFSAQRG